MQELVKYFFFVHPLLRDKVAVTILWCSANEYFKGDSMVDMQTDWQALFLICLYILLWIFCVLYVLFSFSLSFCTYYVHSKR